MRNNGGDSTRALLRTAMLGGVDLSSGTEAIKESASTVLNSVTTNSSGGDLAKITAVAALAAAKTAYDAFNDYNNNVRTATELFDQNYQAGTVTCFLPKKESDYSGYHRCLAAFLQLFQEGEQGYNSPLMRRAGISYNNNVTKYFPGLVGQKSIAGSSFSVMSSAKVVFAGLYASARKEDPILDTARNGSDMLLRAKLRFCLAKIYSHKNDSVLKFEKSLSDAVHPTQHLYHLDLLIFIVTVFANLLVNAQNPADLNLDSSTPLSAQQAKALCAQVKSKLDVILLYDNKKAKSPWAYLNSIQEKELIFDFLTLVKREFEELQEGYQSKILNQLDLNELITQSRGVLQELNELWHQLIYMEKPGTEGVCLVYLVRELSNLLDDHPNFWKRLPLLYTNAELTIPTIPELKQPYGTVMDLLGLFFSLNKKNREALLTQIKEEFPSIKRCLKQMNQDFVETLEAPESFKDSPAQTFLLALIAVSTESHEPFIQEPQRDSGQTSLQRQFSNLNTLHISQQETQKLTFKWDILDSFADAPEDKRKATPSKKKGLPRFAPQTLLAIKDMVRAEYEFLDILRTVSKFQELLDSNKNILLRKNVVAMVKKVLNTFQSKSANLIQAMESLYTQVDMVDKISPIEKDSTSNLRRQFILETLSDKQTETSGANSSVKPVSSNKQALFRAKYTKTLIIAAIEMVTSSGFTQHLLQNMEAAVDAIVYASHEEFLSDHDALLSALQGTNPLLKQSSILERSASQPISNATHEEATDAHYSTATLSKRVMDAQPSIQSIKPSAQQAPIAQSQTPNQSLRLLFILRIMRAISVFLMLSGLAILLALTLGAPYFPIIAALSAQQMSVGMTASSISTVVGTVGLGLAYFFKPGPTKPDAAGNERTSRLEMK